MMEGERRTSGWVGALLNAKWRINAQIGEGGCATVFRATHQGNGCVAAIKIMHPQLCQNADLRARFLREAYAANQVGHSGVVRVLEHDIAEDGSPYIVMDLLVGGELLRERWEKRGRRLPVPEVALICDQVLSVLVLAHEKGIVHRDIKPDNVYVLANDNVRVLDFGLAHIKQAVLEYEPTRAGLLLGTPEFMSPEQALGQPGQIDAQSDLYGVGAMMFTLLSGETVHVGHDQLTGLVLATATRQARSLGVVPLNNKGSAALPPVLPNEIIAVVDTALALEKGRRWRSARAMQESLRRAVPNVAYAEPFSAKSNSNGNDDETAMYATAPLPVLTSSAAPTAPPARPAPPAPLKNPPGMATLLSKGAKPPPPRPKEIHTATLRSKGASPSPPVPVAPPPPTMHSPSGSIVTTSSPSATADSRVVSTAPPSPTMVFNPPSTLAAPTPSTVGTSTEDIATESVPPLDKLTETVRGDADAQTAARMTAPASARARLDEPEVGTDDLAGQQRTVRLQPYQLPHSNNNNNNNVPPADSAQSTTAPLPPLPALQALQAPPQPPSDPYPFRENTPRPFPAAPQNQDQRVGSDPARIARSRRTAETVKRTIPPKNPHATITFVAVALLVLAISLWVGGCLLLRLP